MQPHNSVDTERLILQSLPEGSGQTKWPGKRIFSCSADAAKGKLRFFLLFLLPSRRVALVAEQHQSAELVENIFIFIRFTPMQRASISRVLKGDG